MAFGLPNISFVGYPVPIPCAGHAGLGLREVLRSDVPEIIEHLRALDAEDRRMRFCASVNDGHVVRHAEELLERRSGDVDKPRILGAFNEKTPELGGLIATRMGQFQTELIKAVQQGAAGAKAN